MVQDRQTETSTWGLITTIVAAVPIIGAVGFLVAFLHEVGYTMVYQFPIEFVKLDSATILQYVAVTLLLLLIFILTGTILALILYKKPRGIWVFLAYANFFLIPIFFYASFKNYFGQISPYVSLGLLIIQIILMIPLNWQRGDDVKLTQKIKALSKNGLSLIILIIFILCAMAYMTGFMDGNFKRTYLTPSSNPDSVVLNIYGDNAICAPLADDNITIQRSYFILKIDEPGLIFSTREFPNHLFVKPK